MRSLHRRLVRAAAFFAVLLPFAASAQPLDKRSFADIVRLFESGDTATRVSIAEHWGKKREAQSADVLAKALGFDADALVRSKAAWALGTMGAASAGAAPALHKAVTSDAASSVRYMAAWALGRMGAQGGGAALAQALRDSDVAVRAQAAKSLGEVGDKSVIGDLKRLLADSAKQVRNAGILALQRLGLSDAEIRGALPAADREGAITAEKKSQGVGIALGLVGAGLLYADRTALGAATLGTFVVGTALAVVGAMKGGLDTRTVCPVPTTATGCPTLPVQESVSPGAKGALLAGLVLAAGAWLTSVVGTPLAITKYNQRIDDAKRTAAPRWEPYFELRADATVFGATLRF
jgi:hypothetical protein